MKDDLKGHPWSMQICATWQQSRGSIVSNNLNILPDSVAQDVVHRMHSDKRAQFYCFNISCMWQKLNCLPSWLQTGSFVAPLVHQVQYRWRMSYGRDWLGYSLEQCVSDERTVNYFDFLNRLIFQYIWAFCSGRGMCYAILLQCKLGLFSWVQSGLW